MPLWRPHQRVHPLRQDSKMDQTMSKLIVVVLWLYSFGCMYLLLAKPHWFPTSLHNGALCGTITGCLCAVLTTIFEIKYPIP